MGVIGAMENRSGEIWSKCQLEGNFLRILIFFDAELIGNPAQTGTAKLMKQFSILDNFPG